MENWVKWELGFKRILEFDGTNVRFSFGVPEGSHGEVSTAGVGFRGRQEATPPWWVAGVNCDLFFVTCQNVTISSLSPSFHRVIPHHHPRHYVQPATILW